jgi:hypothetical protein
MTILQNPCTSPVKTYLTESKIMYKSTDRTQQNFLDFNQPMGPRHGSRQPLDQACRQHPLG